MHKADFDLLSGALCREHRHAEMSGTRTDVQRVEHTVLTIAEAIAGQNRSFLPVAWILDSCGVRAVSQLTTGSRRDLQERFGTTRREIPVRPGDRSKQARALAHAVAGQVGANRWDVGAEYINERTGYRITWTNGPTWGTMRALIDELMADEPVIERLLQAGQNSDFKMAALVLTRDSVVFLGRMPGGVTPLRPRPDGGAQLWMTTSRPRMPSATRRARIDGTSPTAVAARSQHAAATGADPSPWHPPAPARSCITTVCRRCGAAAAEGTLPSAGAAKWVFSWWAGPSRDDQPVRAWIAIGA
jgi:hypothetical protein